MWNSRFYLCFKGIVSLYTVFVIRMVYWKIYNGKIFCFFAITKFILQKGIKLVLNSLYRFKKQNIYPREVLKFLYHKIFIRICTKSVVYFTNSSGQVEFLLFSFEIKFNLLFSWKVERYRNQVCHYLFMQMCDIRFVTISARCLPNSF